LLIKYIKSILWRVAKCLSYIEEARCLKVKHFKQAHDSVRREVSSNIYIFLVSYLLAVNEVHKNLLQCNAQPVG